MSDLQTTGQNYYIKVANKFFENVTKCKHLAAMATNQNCIRQEIKSRQNKGNALPCTSEYFVFLSTIQKT